MDVSPHSPSEILQPPYISIGFIFHQSGLRLQTPQHTIEQRKSFTINMKDHNFRKLQKIARYPKLRCIGWGIGQAGAVIGKQIDSVILWRFPYRPVRRNSRSRQIACGVPPAFKIIGRRKGNAKRRELSKSARQSHANSSNCSFRVDGATMLRKSARSVSRTGRQSSAIMKGRTLASETVSLPTSARRSLR